MTSRQLKQYSGFTLIELVVTIVISAILAVGIVSFIGDSVSSLTTSTNRNQMASAGRVALDRLAMEVHNALPNSIRATTATGAGDQCLEFIPVRAASSYINPPFTGGGGITFDVVDFTPSQHGVTGGYAVIYPSVQNHLYDGDNGASTGWPSFPNRRPIQEIASIQDSVSPNQSTVTLVTTHRFNNTSPNLRFFVVEDPISYCVVGDKLYRYTNYGFFTSQVTVEEEVAVCEKALNQRCLPNYSDSPNKMLISDSIDNTGLTAFTVGTQSLNRNALVVIELNFVANGESIKLNHEVLTRSVP